MGERPVRPVPSGGGPGSAEAGASLGYCTNVHAGHDLAATLANLRLHAAQVRRVLDVPELGIGLWLSADAAREAVAAEGLVPIPHHARRSSPASPDASLKDELRRLGLRVFTLNGFPFSNFHEPVVKHRVYEPDWADPRRLDYTMDLVALLASLIDEGDEGSISTLPVGWPSHPCTPVDQDVAAERLRHAARVLDRLEQETGRLIHLDLEPEPGCILGSSRDAVRFWNERLLLGHAAEEAVIRRHLRICHDVCHAAVVFEEQHEAIGRYRSTGILVGKVQISSAPRVDFDALPEIEREAAWKALHAFVEPRYLHQTGVKTDRCRGYADLPDAIAANAAAPGRAPRGEWRVHFHVPIHLARVGVLSTSQDQIAPCLRLANEMGVRHYEVETYAWTVLPSELAPPSLAEGIASELRWVMPLVPTIQQPRRRSFEPPVQAGSMGEPGVERADAD